MSSSEKYCTPMPFLHVVPQYQTQNTTTRGPTWPWQYAVLCKAFENNLPDWGYQLTKKWSDSYEPATGQDRPRVLHVKLTIINGQQFQQRCHLKEILRSRHLGIRGLCVMKLLTWFSGDLKKRKRNLSLSKCTDIIILHVATHLILLFFDRGTDLK